MPSVLTVNVGSTSEKVVLVAADDAPTPFERLDDALRSTRPDLVAHRVVHGGDRAGAVLLDDAEVESLRQLAERAPLHQPAALAEGVKLIIANALALGVAFGLNWSGEQVALTMALVNSVLAVVGGLFVRSKVTPTG